MEFQGVLRRILRGFGENPVGFKGFTWGFGGFQGVFKGITGVLRGFSLNF